MERLIDVVVLGLSHQTAPLAVREKLAVQPELIEPVLRQIAALPGVREAALLCTCNRVEIYAVANDGEAALKALGSDLAVRAALADAELEPHLYARSDTQAVHHLFRVASSLDSLVIGESQILGQVKATHETAVRCGTAGPILNLCFSRSFRVAKRVRTETAIARNPTSISSVAIELVRQVFGGFQGRHVLIVGAGEMADLAARALQGQGASLTVTNRTPARAEELAARMNCGTHSFDDLAGALLKADIVLASTGAQRPVLTRAMLAQVQRGRRGRPLFVIDIAVPRDVEPESADIKGLYLADIDDLQKVAAAHRDTRRTEADQAESIVEQELARFIQSYRGRQVGPTVTALRARVLGLYRADAEKIIASFPQLGEREQRAILELAEGSAKKLLHPLQMALKRDAGDALPLVAAVQLLFELTVVEAVGSADSGGDEDERAPAPPAAAESAQAAEDDTAAQKKATGG
ncbi:MAG TPA: glutamyl-tRNA reductase [Polyangia bacterium]|jgi:glutamyl-tRNA reductase|nr:glutamyl-tRNA reductase [Polyangia bacterium]